MIPKNLIIPLLAFGMYSQANNINLSNNTTIMIIILALIVEQKEIENLAKVEVAEAVVTNNNNSCPCASNANNRSGCPLAQNVAPVAEPVVPVFMTPNRCSSQFVVPVSTGCGCQNFVTTQNTGRCGCPELFVAPVNNQCGCPNIFTTQNSGRCGCVDPFATSINNRCGCQTQNIGRCGCQTQNIGRCGCQTQNIGRCGCNNMLF